MSQRVVNTKKVAVIGTNGLPANYGGWETLVEHLTHNLQGKIDFTVYCSSQNYQDRLEEHNGARLKYVPIGANGISSIIYDIVTMVHASRYADALLILGVSGCIFLPLLKLMTTKTLVVNIDGIEWKRDKWRGFAKSFLKLSEKLAVRFADTVISDNIEISRYVKNEYGVDSEVIAYGGDHVSKFDVNDTDIAMYPFLSDKYAFTVCRIEPENNIHLLLGAYSRFYEFPLIIVGNWSNSAYGDRLKEKYHNGESIILLDPIYNQESLNILRSNAYVYLHGHSVGGTNPSLVEAMGLALPVIAFDVSYNRATTHDLALYFDSSDELYSLLCSINRDELNRVSRDMLKVAGDNYTWAYISERYRQILDSGDASPSGGLN